MSIDYIQLYIKFKDELNITSYDRYDIIDYFEGIISEDNDIINYVIAIIPIYNVQHLKNDNRILYVTPLYKGEITPQTQPQIQQYQYTTKEKIKQPKKITKEELFNAEANTISEIIKTKRNEIHKKRHVNGSGLSYDESKKEHYLVIFLTEYDEETINTLPTEIDGFKVTYKIIGIVKPIPVYCNYPGDAVYPGKYRPIQAGSSVGNVNIIQTGYCDGGTLSGFPALVSDITKRVILSNNHILAHDYPGSRLAAVGDNIVQPGTVDGADTDTDVIGTLQWWVSVLEKPSINIVDCAYALINDGISVNTTTTLCGYDIVGPSILPIGNLPVKKSGRTSGCTTGHITNYNTTIDIDYGGFIVTFDKQIVTSTQAISGDSGSLLLRSDTNQPVGLIFAVGTDATFANRIVDVEKSLNVTFDTCPTMSASLLCPSEIYTGQSGLFNTTVIGGVPDFTYEIYINDTLYTTSVSSSKTYDILIPSTSTFFNQNTYNTCYVKVTNTCIPPTSFTTSTCTFYVGDIKSINIAGCDTKCVGSVCNLNLNETCQFTSQCIAPDDSTITCPTPIVWNSTDTTVATINSSGLLTTLNKIGSTTITATSGGKISNSITVNSGTTYTIKVGRYWDLKNGLSQTLDPETYTFDMSQWPIGDHSNPDDYASSIGEPQENSRSEMVAVLINVKNLNVTTLGDMSIKWTYPNGTVFYTFKANFDVGIFSVPISSWVGRFPNEINITGNYTIDITSPWLNASTGFTITSSCQIPICNITVT